MDVLIKTLNKCLGLMLMYRGLEYLEDSGGGIMVYNLMCYD